MTAEASLRNARGQRRSAPATCLPRSSTALRGDAGYVSLEVSPELANDQAATVVAARRLRGAVDRPNVLIKIPATEAGIKAIRTLIGEGISINVTLMFSLADVDAATPYPRPGALAPVGVTSPPSSRSPACS